MLCGRCYWLSYSQCAVGPHPSSSCPVLTALTRERTGNVGHKSCQPWAPTAQDNNRGSGRRQQPTTTNNMNIPTTAQHQSLVQSVAQRYRQQQARGRLSGDSYDTDETDQHQDGHELLLESPMMWAKSPAQRYRALLLRDQQDENADKERVEEE